MNISYINREAEEYFKTLADNKEALDICYQHICNTLDKGLAELDFEKLLSLIPYITSGEGHLAFEHIGESRRILRILNIISLELKYSDGTFSTECFSKDELMAKYYLTLFAFRRLLFELSETSMEEATQYLQANVISPFAVYILASEELLTPTECFWGTLADIYTPYWTPADSQQFSLLIQQQT